MNNTRRGARSPLSQKKIVLSICALLCVLPLLVGFAALDNYAATTAATEATQTAPGTEAPGVDDAGAVDNDSGGVRPASPSLDSDGSEAPSSNEVAGSGAFQVIPPESPFAPASDIVAPFAITYSSNLADFITAVAMQDMNGNPITSTTPTFIGQSYQFLVSFAETPNLQLQYDGSGNLTYQLPSYLNIPAAIGPVDLVGNAPSYPVIGTYSVSTAGLVTMSFGTLDLNGRPIALNQNFIDFYQDVNITFEVTAVLTAGAGNSLDFGNGVTVSIVPPVEPPPTLSTVKSATYDQTNQQINYTIALTALGGNIDGISLDDLPTLTTSSVTGTTMSNAPTNAFSNFSYEVAGGTATSFSPTINSATSEITYNAFVDGSGNPLVLNQDQTLTITYTLNLPDVVNNNNGPGQALAGDTDANYSFTVDNTATMGGNDADTSPSQALPSASSSTQTPVNRSLSITKTGSYSGAPSTTVNWTITAGDGYSQQLNAVGAVGVITDTLSEGQTISTDLTQIGITYLGLGNVEIATGNATNMGGTFTLDAGPPEGFTFTLPDDSSSYGAIYSVVITLPVTITAPIVGIPGVMYTNDASIDVAGSTEDTTAQVTVNAGMIPMTKLTSGLLGNATTGYYVDYTVSFTIPAGLEGQQIYLYDTLAVFLSDGTVHNVPNVPDPASVNVTYSPTDPTLLNTAPLDLYGNSWRIFFGQDTSPLTAQGTVSSPEVALWPVDTATAVTVSYRVPIDAASAAIMQSSPNNILENAAYLVNSTDTNPILGGQPEFDGQQGPGIPGNIVGGVNTDDIWPIFKSVAGTPNPAVFAYTASLYGNYAQSNAAVTLMEAGSAPQYVDTFDPRMSYVPDTFYVQVGTNYYAPSSDVTVSGNTLTADFAATDWYQLTGPLPGGTPTATPAPANWFVNRSVMTAHYQLEILPAYLGAQQDSLTNTAEIFTDAGTPPTTANPSSFSNGAVTSYSPQVLEKTMLADPPGSDRVLVTIVINPSGGYVFTDSAGNAPALVSAVDLFRNLQIFTDTITMETQTETSPGVWDGTWIPAPNPLTFNTGAAYSATVVPAAQVPAGYAGQIDFVVPNQTPVQISYWALVDLPVGQTGAISNAITVMGVSDSAGDNQYVVGGTHVGVGAGRQDLRLFKTDSVGNNLMGAQFSLYVTDLSAGNTPPGGLATDLTLTGTGGTSFNFAQLPSDASVPPGEVVQTTDAGGVATFSNGSITSSYRYLYLLVEQSAPTGYYYNTPYTFFTMSQQVTPADTSSLNTQLSPVLVSGQSVQRVSDFVSVVNYPLQTVPYTLNIVKEFSGVTSATVNQYLTDFQLVVTDPFQREFTYDLATATDPTGIVFTNFTPGNWTITERNAQIPGFDLTANPSLPFTTSLVPNPQGQVTLVVQNNYAPEVVSQPPLTPPPGSETPGAPGTPVTGPATGDVLFAFNGLLMLLALLTIIASTTALTRTHSKGSASM
ncbi:MAG: hypothetical protein FWE46_01165 [Coriobacteriia bacterium]|nr:hypothetical protein [Coriobacteriia bacterium]